MSEELLPCPSESWLIMQLISIQSIVDGSTVRSFNKIRVGRNFFRIHFDIVIFRIYYIMYACLFLEDLGLIGTRLLHWIKILMYSSTC